MNRVLGVLALILAVACGEEMCSWCEAGDSTCDWSFSDYTETIFPLSISGSVNGRGYPYFRPSSQAPLGAANPVTNDKITTAIIVHHGAARNGGDYTSYMTNAVLRSGGSLENTLVLGPQVYESSDEGLDEDRMVWWDYSSDDGADTDGGERDWKWGGNSTAQLAKSISTFSVLDEMLLALADRTVFPNLARVVVSGHSAGGQIVQRYALFSKLGAGGSDHHLLPADLQVSYYVANPSSVTYLGPERPITGTSEDRTCNYCDNSTIITQHWAFAVPNATSAADGCLDSYDNYGYGLQATMPDYPTAVSADGARAQYPLRKVTYMSGESDVCDVDYMTLNHCTSCTVDDGGLDTSCPAHAQGWCRMARLHAFAQYVTEIAYKSDSDNKAKEIAAKKNHMLISVPYVGHSGCGMFQSEQFAAAVLQWQ